MVRNENRTVIASWEKDDLSWWVYFFWLMNIAKSNKSITRKLNYKKLPVAFATNKTQRLFSHEDVFHCKAYGPANYFFWIGWFSKPFASQTPARGEAGLATIPRGLLLSSSFCQDTKFTLVGGGKHFEAQFFNEQQICVY